MNQQVSKALVVHYGTQTLFVVGDLTGIRGATERVRRRDRYTAGSWAFFRLRQVEKIGDVFRYPPVPLKPIRGEYRSWYRTADCDRLSLW